MKKPNLEKRFSEKWRRGEVFLGNVGWCSDPDRD